MNTITATNPIGLLDELINEYDKEFPTALGLELREARAAVAELIEATKDLVEVSQMAVGFGVIPANADGPLPRAIAALARVGGAS